MDRNSTDMFCADEIAEDSVKFAWRLERASQQYRMRLQRKAAMMRAAVLDGETDDARVLQMACAFERLAGDES